MTEELEQDLGRSEHGEHRDSLLSLIAERVRSLRARRGLTRKATAQLAAISERHLANLESGSGNASILVLQQVAVALQCPLAELIGDVTTSSPEWLLLRELLAVRTEEDLRRARVLVGEMLGTSSTDEGRSRRIALIGLRGAGKSTVGKLLADELDFPFIELSSEIERMAGCSLREIYDLYGANAYRRYERRALEETIQIHSEAVIATPGGIVSDPATFNQLLTHCTTVCLRASPEEHMNRVVVQGDLRPLAGSNEAMEDLRRILEGRAAFYSKADLSVDTSGRTPQEALQVLKEQIGAR